MNCSDLKFLFFSPFSLFFAAGLISQFSTNLLEAELVSRANECQRQDSIFNEHSNQDELLKAVLLAGLYPNLIQVHSITGARYNTAFTLNEMLKLEL